MAGSSLVNMHGLSRYIPAGVKARVRELCGFGCVVCGSIPYEYDHFITPWADAKEHDPEDIILLCKQHHHMKTVGIIDRTFIERAMHQPETDRPARFRLPGTNPEFRVHWPANEFDAIRHAIVVDGRSVFEIKYQANELEPVLLSGVFRNRSGDAICEIADNELTFFSQRFGDLRCKSNRFEITDAKRRKALKFSIDNKGLRISQIAHVSGGSMIAANAKGFWVCNGVDIALFRDMAVQKSETVVTVLSRWVRDYEQFDITKEVPKLHFEGFTLTGGKGILQF